MGCTTCGQTTTTIRYRLVLSDGTVHASSPFATRKDAEEARAASGGDGKIRPVRVSS